MYVALWVLGIAIGIAGIVIFNPLVTLVGIGLSLTPLLPKEENNAESE